MKKISLLVLTVMAGTTLFAQNQPQLRTPMAVKPRLGLMAGVNSARLNWDNNSSGSSSSPTINSRTTFHLGVVYNIPLAGALRFEPGLLYQGAGSKFAQSVGSTTADFEYKMHYLSLPLRFQYQTTGGFLVEIFPQASYLMTADQEGPGSSTTNLKSNKYVKKTDFGVGGGIGYISRIGLGIAADYYFGLSDVANGENAPSSSTIKMHNRIISGGLRYYFGAYK